MYNTHLYFFGSHYVIVGSGDAARDFRLFSPCKCRRPSLLSNIRPIFRVHCGNRRGARAGNSRSSSTSQVTCTDMSSTICSHGHTQRHVAYQPRNHQLHNAIMDNIWPDETNNRKQCAATFIYMNHPTSITSLSASGWSKDNTGCLLYPGSLRWCILFLECLSVVVIKRDVQMTQFAKRLCVVLVHAIHGYFWTRV